MAHILVVDDDPRMVADMLARAASMGHTCDTAGDQNTAEELLATHCYDLFLIDREIPREPGGFRSKQFGQNLLERIKLTPGHRTKPVIIVTGYDLDSYELGVEMLKSGAVDVVGKPFGEGRQLEEKIREALEKTVQPHQSAKRQAKGITRIEGRFAGGILNFFPNRVELNGQRIAGPEGGSQIRRVLDFLKEQHLSGERRSCDGAYIARELGIERGQLAVNESVREIRNSCNRAMLHGCHLACGLNDVIGNERHGYFFQPWIQVHDLRDEDQTDEHAAISEQPLTPVQTAILRELQAMPSMSTVLLRSRMQMQAGVLAAELEALMERGLVAREGNGAATRYKLTVPSEGAPA